MKSPLCVIISSCDGRYGHVEDDLIEQSEVGCVGLVVLAQVLAPGMQREVYAKVNREQATISGELLPSATG